MKLANKRWIGAANLLSNRSRHYHVAAFDQMIDDLNAQGVDHVLCTGDVTNLALEQEFAFARHRFDRLAGGPDGVTVIPGNHDAYVAEGIELFGRFFDEYHRPDPGWEWPEDDGSRWPIVRVRGPLALIGVSTSRATPWFTAYGRVGETQLARLGQVLGDPRLAGKARVVAIHHPPAGRASRSIIRGLRDHAAFAEVIRQHGADLVVHGHEHRDMAEVLAGPHGDVPVRGIPSGTYHFNKPHRTARYRIYEIDAGKISGDHVRIWQRDRSCFEPNPST